MAAKVWLGQDTWIRSAGYADLATKTPYGADDHVRIASITKSYTASTVLRLVDAGELGLDDVLETYIPGITNGTKITIEQLMAMTSGVFDFTSDQTFLDAFDADPEMPWSDADTLKIIKANKPSFAPGAELQYCDSNYALLGMIVAKVTGSSTAEAITRAGDLEALAARNPVSDRRLVAGAAPGRLRAGREGDGPERPIRQHQPTRRRTRRRSTRRSPAGQGR